ncbi:MAG: TatD family hydrolase [Treponema sp.]|nr:TatD family hydrolase [Treponema sp.]
MLCDAHCHPADLARPEPDAEGRRLALGVSCASSATTLAEFEFCEALSGKAVPLYPCFAVHPQMPRRLAERPGEFPTVDEGLRILDLLGREGRLSGVGETGFDLYDAGFRASEAVQDLLFAEHLAAALRYGLPLVLHVRRAMHKVFARSRDLARCRSVIFHSWSGTPGEGRSLLGRGINAFFSFGTGVALNHKEAMRCAALLPADRLLTETDSPYQPLRGSAFSTYGDLPAILEVMAALRRNAESPAETVEGLESVIAGNFRSVFESC